MTKWWTSIKRNHSKAEISVPIVNPASAGYGIASIVRATTEAPAIAHPTATIAMAA